MIAKIEVKKKSQVRRAKLYYMRERSGKSARLKGKFVSKEQEKINPNELKKKKVVCYANHLFLLKHKFLKS